MATKQDLQQWIVVALTKRGGRAALVDVAREIWREHEAELRASEDLFFTWQYDMRWAASVLRKQSVLKAVASSQKGLWELVR